MEERALARRRPDQPPARLLGAVAAAARPRDPGADSGSAANWFARDLKIREGMMASLSGTLATMGPGVPYAIAAKFAYPGPRRDRARRRRRDADERHRRADHDRQVLASAGGPAPDRPRAAQQRSQPGHVGAAGDGGRPALRGLAGSSPTSPTRATPSSIGLTGIRVDDPEQIGAAWDEALAADRPVVLEAITDPDVPPLPPHITFEQATHFAQCRRRRRSGRGAA